MRAQFLLSSKFVIPELIKSKRREGRRRASFFIASLLLLSSMLLSAGTPLYVKKAQAAKKTASALKTDKQTKTPLETGAIGKPIKGQEQQLNDPASYQPPEFKEEEIVEKRDEFKSAKRNKDGTITVSESYDRLNYQKNGKWEKIDTTLVEDTNAADSGTVGSIFGKLQSAVKKNNTYKVKNNDWQARFAPSTDGKGMLRYQKGSLTLVYRPVGANKKVNPRVEKTNDGEVITYENLWNGIDVQYEVTGSKIKEYIVFKDRYNQTKVEFKVDGAVLEPMTDRPGAFKVVGHDVIISELSVALNGSGVISEPVATQTYEDWKLKVTLDETWFRSLPDESFPVVIDPTTTGLYHNGLNYTAFKSDGYVCGSNSCYMNAGTLYDRGWKHWRTIFCPNYNDFLNPGVDRKITWAGLYLNKKNPPPNYWFGVSEGRSFEVSHATSWQFNSINWGLPRTGAWFAQDGWINMTPQMQHFVHNNIPGACFVINGEEVAGNTWKAFIDNAIMQYTYTDKATEPTPILPADKQTVVTDQPSLSVNPASNPNGDQIRYYFRIATGSNAESGTVINSGDVDGTQWTVPEGMLQDGQTYYWHTYSSRWVNGVNYGYTTPTWVRSFKYDARTGKDSTQTYDTAGPISIGLATGNATTSASSHTMSALGGAIGIGLEYNSPKKSKPGLLGEYFSNVSFSGAPVLTRTDQKIDFNWAGSNPSYGVMPNDNFSVRWTGYFVAPTTGDYYFGSNRDDNFTIFLNNTAVHSGTCCGQTWQTTPTYLTAGQVVPIRVDYQESVGAAVAMLKIKGAVPEQTVPTEWLRTPLRETDPSTGLRTNFYNDYNNHTLPTNPSNAFASRIESRAAFNYGGGSPVPIGPTDTWMATMEGYITVPVTGDYQFGTVADDAARVYVNNQLVVNDWAHDGAVSNAWGGNINLKGGVSVPIRIEYYEIGGGAAFNLFVRGAVGQQEVPSTWLSSRTKVLPSGWQLSLDADGNLAYDYAKIGQNNVILNNADGTTYEYTWNGSSYKAPTNSYGIMTRNADGSITLQEADGRTYIFGADGFLKEVTSPVDDLKPAALRYTYSGFPPRISKIADGVDPSRFATVHYKGEADCPAAIAGFDAQAPDNMLCAFKTTDGDKTNFFYKQGQLARIELPGGDITDIGYDTHGRIVQQKSSLANEAVQAGVRLDDATITSEIQYDSLGRVSKVIEPAPNAGDPRREHTYEYTGLKFNNWSTPEQIPGEFPASGLTATNWGADKVALSYRTPTNATGYKFYENGVWTDQANQPSCIRDYPGITSQRDGNIESFVRGCDDRVYRQSYNNGIWSAFALNPGGALTNAAPSATSWGDGRIDVEIRGADNALWHGTWVGANWYGPTSLGGGLSTGPSVSTWGDNRLNLFVTDMGSPSKIVTRHWAAGWENFTQLTNEPIASSVASVSTPTKDIHVAVRNTSNQLRYMSYSGSSNTWSAWTTVAACITDNPTIANQGYGDAVIIYKGCDGKLYQVKQTAITGTATMRSSNTSEPNGYSQKIEYDSTLRTVKAYDKAGNANVVDYHPIKDIVYSSTSATGLRSTSVYDQNDLPVESYGPAPKEWFDASKRPLSAYGSQVPRTDKKYDENIVGLNVSWYDYKNKTLFGAPKLHSTGIKSVGSKTAMGRNFANEGVPFTKSADAQGFGFRATGKVTFPTSGTYNFNFYHADGARLFIDNKPIVDFWNDSAGVRTDSGSFVATAGKSYDIRTEFYTLSNTSPGLSIGARLGANPENGDWASIGILLKPAYNLQTSTKVYDAQLGDSLSTINYGPNPELGQVVGTTSDAGGLNYTNTATYEAYGAVNSYLRQTSSTLPGGNTTNYAYYGATESASNPCVTNSPAVSQAGRSKLTTEQDPDGAGSASSRLKEVRYDAKGRVVASRMNNDPWTCSTYDARGRTTASTQPDIQGRPGRTVTYTYAVDGNPLKTRVTDSIVGSNESEIDLLGRTKWSKDIWGNIYTTTYDANGRVATITSPVGTETRDYDNLDRALNYKLDGVVLATMTYDNFSRVTGIEYTQAKDAQGNKLKMTQVKRDALQRGVGSVYQTSDGKTFDETVVLSQSGKIIGATQNYDTQSLTSSFSFDKLGRMTAATVGQTKFDYGYGAPDATCTIIAGNNVNANRNSNRTSYTVTNLVTNIVAQNDKHCYDQADRLMRSTDVQVGVPTYDDHGNTVSLAGNGTPITFRYNASDYNIAIEQGTKRVEYVKTASGAIVRKKEFSNGTLQKNYRYVAGGRILQSCSLTDDNSCTTVDTYINLPGGIQQTNSKKTVTTGGQSTLVVRAAGNIGDEVVEVMVDGVAIGTFTPQGNLNQLWDPTWSNHTFTRPGTLTASQIKLNYINDAVTPSGSRDVRVDYIEINGQRFETEAPEVIQSGGWGNGSTCSTGNFSIDNLACNGYFQYSGGGGAVTGASTSMVDTKKYSLKNYHGDTALVLEADGKTDTSLNTQTGLPNCAGCNKLKAYGPFGESLLPGTLGATDDTAINATDATMGWAASPSRKVEGTFSIPLIQMGARVYLPTLGCFLQVDPVEGGTLNPYVYAHDPVNMNDYSGQFVMALPLIFVAPIAWGAVAEAALWTAAAGTAIYVGAKGGEAYRNRAQAKPVTKSYPIPIAPPDKRTCYNCGIYKFTDTGATNPANKGKTYVGKTVNFDTRLAQHGARITPGTVQKIDMSGQSLQAIRLREQLEINAELLKLGGVPFGVKSGLLANKINGISEKNFQDNFQESMEFPTF